MSEENIEYTTEQNSSFAPTFVDNHVLLDFSFNRHCIIKNNIFIIKEASLKSNKYTYFLHARKSTIKKFKRRFYMR